MLHSQFRSRAVACLAAYCVSTCSLPANCQIHHVLDTEMPAAPETGVASRQTDNKLLIAHCGGCDLGAIQLMEQSSGPKLAAGSVLSDSLWGNLILSMAYQRDKELQRLAKRQGLANVVTLGSVGAVSGLSLAQNITTLAGLNSGHSHQAELPSAPAASSVSPDGEMSTMADHNASQDTHNSSEQHSPVPGILGLIASGGTIFALVTQVYLNHRYRKKVTARELVIRQHVEEILAHLEAGLHCMDCQKELSVLIGDRASREFIQLWRSTHAVAAGPGVSG